MTKPYFLMKPEKARPELLPASAMWSIKYDGIRAFWDGGITRGKKDVPWAMGTLATGLWTNNGKPIYAPDYWLNSLPSFPCDGELWAGPGRYNFTSSVVRTKNGSKDPQWLEIHFMHHTDIDLESFLQPRLVEQPHCNFIFTPSTREYYMDAMLKGPLKTYSDSLMTGLYDRTEWFPVESWDHLNNVVLPKMLELGHEGIMIKDTNLEWEPVRSKKLLKLKPWHDDEAYVVGVTAGKDGHAGKAGGLILKWHKVLFGVGNLLLPERTLMSIDTSVDPVAVALDMPGETLPACVQCVAYPNGTKVTFKYKEKTPNGIPREPSLWRRRSER